MYIYLCCMCVNSLMSLIILEALPEYILQPGSWHHGHLEQKVRGQCVLGSKYS
jgi:hypothetical protein